MLTKAFYTTKKNYVVLNKFKFFTIKNQSIVVVSTQRGELY